MITGFDMVKHQFKQEFSRFQQWQLSWKISRWRNKIKDLILGTEYFRIFNTFKSKTLSNWNLNNFLFDSIRFPSYSCEPAIRNESYDESESTKGSNDEPSQIEQSNGEKTSSNRSVRIKRHDIVERNETESNVRNFSVMTDVYIDLFVYFKKDIHGESNDALLPTSPGRWFRNQYSTNIRRKPAGNLLFSGWKRLKNAPNGAEKSCDRIRLPFMAGSDRIQVKLKVMKLEIVLAERDIAL